ncbi:site-specific integrase [Neobacillus sp. PS3-40]|uniref:site-specific integrase n=1 Tax=Neobacillus sp. PS3-40 TaxID=3070679 RepID=UPI0027E17B4C|nr:site-specific integrase [Neobacillus sp. PS3-40]WML44078.1 site-specific integrase [Neobacillus sp. PS3-40]
MEFVEPIRDRKKIDDIKKYLQSNKRDYLLFVLGINSALRVSDLLELKFEDLIDANLKPLDHIKLKETKTGKHNKIAISKGVKKAIVDYVKHYYKGQLSDYIFYSRKGNNQPIQRQMAWRLIKKAADVVGVKDIGSHSLRKTWAYHSYKAGTDIVIIQDMLNHSSPSVTLRYIGITQDEKDRAVLTLDL